MVVKEGCSLSLGESGSAARFAPSYLVEGGGVMEWASSGCGQWGGDVVGRGYGRGGHGRCDGGGGRNGGSGAWWWWRTVVVARSGGGARWWWWRAVVVAHGGGGAQRWWRAVVVAHGGGGGECSGGRVTTTSEW